MMKLIAALLLLAPSLAPAPARADVVDNLRMEEARAIAQSLRALAPLFAHADPEPFAVRGDVDSWFGLQWDFDRASAAAEAECARSGPRARVVGDSLRYRTADRKAEVVSLCAPGGSASANGRIHVLLGEARKSSDEKALAQSLADRCASQGGSAAKIVGETHRTAADASPDGESERIDGVCAFQP